MSPSATSASFRFFQSNSSPNFSFNTSCYIDVTLYRSLRALRNSCSGYSAVDILLCKSAHSGVTLSSASQCLYTVISIVIPRVFPPQPEVIHQAAAKFVSRLEKSVALKKASPWLGNFPFPSFLVTKATRSCHSRHMSIDPSLPSSPAAIPFLS